MGSYKKALYLVARPLRLSIKGQATEKLPSFAASLSNTLFKRHNNVVVLVESYYLLEYSKYFKNSGTAFLSLHSQSSTFRLKENKDKLAIK